MVTARWFHERLSANRSGSARKQVARLASELAAADGGGSPAFARGC
jgi:hypothetical protein